MYTLRTTGDPVLTQIADPVQDLPTSDLLTSMLEICQRYGGIGLAAPQVGKSVRIILINTLTEQRFIINPVITPDRVRGRAVKQEGCLSYPGRSARAKRWKRIKVTGRDVNGDSFETYYTGINARVIQHEVDHLNGKCIVSEGKS